MQQSIRTFFNLSQPKRCYVKTALSILNMGFMRGLSPYYMSRTPEINAFVAELIDSDPLFAKQRFVLLREIAAIGYHHRYYEQALEKDTPYKKMLSALWRESLMLSASRASFNKTRPATDDPGCAAAPG